MTVTLADTFIRQFEGHNQRLRKAIEGLDPETLDRVIAPETNSIAVLIAHVSGSELGWLHLAAGREFKRDRAAEFRTRSKTAAELAAMIDRAARLMPDLVRGAIDGGLETVRRRRENEELTAGYSLIHALEHLAEHVGQIELTRQLVTRE